MASDGAKVTLRMMILENGIHQLNTYIRKTVKMTRSSSKRITMRRYQFARQAQLIIKHLRVLISL